MHIGIFVGKKSILVSKVMLKSVINMSCTGLFIHTTRTYGLYGQKRIACNAFFSVRPVYVRGVCTGFKWVITLIEVLTVAVYRTILNRVEMCSHG